MDVIVVSLMRLRQDITHLRQSRARVFVFPGPQAKSINRVVPRYTTKERERV